MSLLHWFPLNGNIDDYGIKNYTNVSSNAVVNANGKIGLCYSFSSNLKIDYTLPALITSSIGTMACWVKFNSIPGSNQWFALMQIGTAGGFASCVMGMYIWNNGGQTVLQFSLNGSSGSDTPNNNFNYTFATNKWYHIALSYDGTAVKLYIDGELVNTVASGVKKSYTTGTHLFIGGTSSYYLNGYMNDVRYYNNVLSDEEIKEIAKALIIHYPLSGTPEINEFLCPIRLPSEYLEVEYIENDSAGNAYLNLNYTPTTFTKMEMRGAFAISNLNSTRNFVSTIGPSSLSHYIEVSSNNKAGCLNLLTSKAINNNDKIIFSNLITPSKLTVSIWTDKDTFVDGDNTTYQGTTVTPVLLFRLAEGYTGHNIRFYRCSLFDNDILVRYLIPCFRCNDKVMGMYDLVNNVFYTNANSSGTFICGPVKATIPNTYTPVEYLYMKKGKMIDTGIIVSSTHLFNFKYAILTTQQWYGAFGAYMGESNNTTRIIMNSTSTTNIFVYFMSRAGSGGAPAVNNVLSGLGDIIEGYMNYNKTYLYNHTTKKSFDITNTHIAGTADTSTMKLSSETSGAGSSNYYYFDTYNNNIPILCLRPVIRNSDNVPGFYDLVTNTFMIPTGSGDALVPGGISNKEDNIKGSKSDGTYTKSIGTILSNNNPIKIRYLDYLKFTGTNSLYNTAFPYSTNMQTVWSTSIWFYYTALTNALLTLYAIHLPNAQADANTKVRPMITASSTANSLSTFAEGKYITISNLTTNTWHHLVCTCDGTTFTAYLDGESKGTATSLTFKSNTNLLIIGAYGTNKLTAPLTNGSVSDFRFYTTCLSADEVLKLYQMGNPN